MRRPHRGRMQACRNRLHDMKNNRFFSNQMQTFTWISNTSILNFLQAILVISKLMSKAHRGRLLACRSNLTDMKNNRSPSQIKTFTQISNNSILSVLQPVMVPSKLLGKPNNSRWISCRSNLNDIKNNRSSTNQVKTFTRISINNILMRTQLVGIKLMGNPHSSSLYTRSQRMYISRINIGLSNQIQI